MITGKKGMSARCDLCRRQVLEEPHVFCNEISSHLLFFMGTPVKKRSRDEDDDEEIREVPVPNLTFDSLKSILLKVPLIDLRAICSSNSVVAEICTEQIFLSNYVQENLWRFNRLLSDLLEHEPPLELTFVRWREYVVQFGNGEWVPSRRLFNLAVNRVAIDALYSILRMIGLVDPDGMQRLLEEVVWKLTTRPIEEYNPRQLDTMHRFVLSAFKERLVSLDDHGYEIVEALVKNDFSQELKWALRTATSQNFQNSIIQNTFNPMLKVAVKLPTSECIDILLFNLMYGNFAAERARPKRLFDCIKRGFQSASLKIIQHSVLLDLEHTGLIFLGEALDRTHTAIVGELLWHPQFPHEQLDDNLRIEILEVTSAHADNENDLLRILRYKDASGDFPFAEIATPAPFDSAIEKDFVDSVLLMLQYSENLEFDRYGWYYVNHAMELGHAEIVDLLMSQDDSPRLTPSRKAKLEEFQRRNELQPKKLNF